jgi:hypothetical protein
VRRREQRSDFSEQLNLVRDFEVQTNVFDPQQFADGVHCEQFRRFIL